MHILLGTFYSKKQGHAGSIIELNQRRMFTETHHENIEKLIMTLPC